MARHMQTPVVSRYGAPQGIGSGSCPSVGQVEHPRSEGAEVMRVYKIDSDWFVAESPDAAKLAWEGFYGTDWDGDDDLQAEPDDESLTIEERGDDDKDLTKTHAEWAQFNGPGWLASEV